MRRGRVLLRCKTQGHALFIRRLADEYCLENSIKNFVSTVFNVLMWKILLLELTRASEVKKKDVL